MTHYKDWYFYKIFLPQKRALALKEAAKLADRQRDAFEKAMDCMQKLEDTIKGMDK